MAKVIRRATGGQPHSVYRAQYKRERKFKRLVSKYGLAKACKMLGRDPKHWQ